MKYFTIFVLLVCPKIFGQSNQEKLIRLSQNFDIKYNFEVEKARLLFPNLSKLELKRMIGFGENNVPIMVSTDNLDAGKSTNADLILNTTIDGNMIQLSGNGITVYIWDGGPVRTTHQELNGRVTVIDAGTNSDHATHVAGTIAATGVAPAAKGMAPSVNIKSYDFYNPFTEIAAATDAKLSNHSWGTVEGWSYRYATDGYPANGWYFFGDYSASGSNGINTNGYYNQRSKEWDQIGYLQPFHKIFKSAGNSFNTGPNQSAAVSYYWNGSAWTLMSFGSVPPNECKPSNYDCLSPGSNAKNTIVVAAANQFSTPNYRYTTNTDVIKASFSSAGPRDDGGIKPDITAIGTNMYSSIASSNNAYASYEGTSMSTPNVTGIASLLEQYNIQKFGNSMRSDMMKALLVNSANEAGEFTGPDYYFGWGFINAYLALTTMVMNEKTTLMENNVLNNGAVFEKIITSDGNPLKVTISWLDPAAEPVASSVSLNNRISRLINDLDLRIVDVVDNTTYYPWKLDPENPSAEATTGDNNVDNVEQVYIETPIANRQYKIMISHKGNLINDNLDITPSNYALVVSGIKLGSLSVNDILAVNTTIKLFPNPAKDRIQIQTSRDNVIQAITIFDATGKLLKYISEIPNNNFIDITNFIKGAYFISVDTTNGSITEKFIKE